MRTCLVALKTLWSNEKTWMTAKVRAAITSYPTFRRAWTKSAAPARRAWQRATTGSRKEAQKEQSMDKKCEENAANKEVKAIATAGNLPITSFSVSGLHTEKWPCHCSTKLRESLPPGWSGWGCGKKGERHPREVRKELEQHLIQICSTTKFTLVDSSQANA